MTDNPLKMKVPPQKQTNWCWAATTVGVSQGYVPPVAPDTGVKQCEVVNRRLGVGHCCNQPDGCNVQSGLTLPLFEAGHHCVTYANKLTFDEIVAEIEAERPVCARVVWESGFGDGHFVVIFGFIKAEDEVVGKIEDVIVADSIYGVSIHTFEAFRKFYRTTVQTDEGAETHEGVWTHSYYTRPAVPEADPECEEQIA